MESPRKTAHVAHRVASGSRSQPSGSAKAATGVVALLRTIETQQPESGAPQPAHDDRYGSSPQPFATAFEPRARKTSGAGPVERDQSRFFHHQARRRLNRAPG